MNLDEFKALKDKKWRVETRFKKTGVVYVLEGSLCVHSAGSEKMCGSFCPHFGMAFMVPGSSGVNKAYAFITCGSAIKYLNLDIPE